MTTANQPLATTYRAGLMSPADKVQIAANTAALASGVASSADLNTAQQNLLYQGLLIAALRNVPTGLVDGILDPYSSLADINTGASSGYTFSSSAGTIGATVTPAQSAGAYQTSANAIANGAQSGYPASQAFDGSTSTAWGANETGSGIPGVSWIGQDFGTGNAKTLSSIVVTAYGNSTYNVGSVYLECADGAAWTNLGTFTLSTATNSQTTINVPNGSGAHRQWRLRAAANASSGLAGWFVPEIVMSGPSTAASTAAMVLQSATLPSAVASPSAMRALIQVDSTSVALAPNADVLASLSRDGATYTQGTLATVQSMPDGTIVLDTGWVPVTGQPTGNSTMTYLVRTPTQKAAVLTGGAMMVRP